MGRCGACLCMSNFRDLIAYQRAVALADDLRAVIRTWQSLDQWTLGIQLLRAADSVGANLAEACGRGSYADERRFLLFARGSAYETQHWIERAVSRSLLDDNSIRARAAAVGKLINGLIRANQRRSRTTNDE
jgi:four helix bundle protein